MMAKNGSPDGGAERWKMRVLCGLRLTKRVCRLMWRLIVLDIVETEPGIVCS